MLLPQTNMTVEPQEAACRKQ